MGPEEVVGPGGGAEASVDLSDERMPRGGWDNWERVKHHLGLMDERDEIIHSGRVAPFEVWEKLRDNLETEVVEPLEDIYRRNFTGAEPPSALPLADVATVVACVTRAEFINQDLKYGARPLNPEPLPQAICDFSFYGDLKVYIQHAFRGEPEEDWDGRPATLDVIILNLRNALNTFDENVGAWQKNLVEKGILVEVDEDEDDN